MDTGRMHCFCVATKEGQVIYERFYDRLNELEKGEMRAALQHASGNVRFTADEQDFVAAYRSARFAFMPSADCVYYLMGSGEYEDLALVEVLRVILVALRDALGRPPTATGLLDKYTRLVLVVDEVINEGILEATDRDSIRRGLKSKALLRELSRLENELEVERKRIAAMVRAQEASSTLADELDMLLQAKGQMAQQICQLEREHDYMVMERELLCEQLGASGSTNLCRAVSAEMARAEELSQLAADAQQEASKLTAQLIAQHEQHIIEHAMWQARELKLQQLVEAQFNVLLQKSQQAPHAGCGAVSGTGWRTPWSTDTIIAAVAQQKAMREVAHSLGGASRGTPPGPPHPSTIWHGPLGHGSVHTHPHSSRPAVSAAAAAATLAPSTATGRALDLHELALAARSGWRSNSLAPAPHLAALAEEDESASPDDPETVVRLCRSDQALLHKPPSVGEKLALVPARRVASSGSLAPPHGTCHVQALRRPSLDTPAAAKSVVGLVKGQAAVATAAGAAVAAAAERPAGSIVSAPVSAAGRCSEAETVREDAAACPLGSGDGWHVKASSEVSAEQAAVNGSSLQGETGNTNSDMFSFVMRGAAVAEFAMVGGQC